MRWVLVMAGVSAVALVGWSLLQASGAQPIPDSATRAAIAGGCGEMETPASGPQGGHLSAGQSYSYSEEPATSGLHDPSPLPASPHVYTSPVPETKAVHNLEHAYVLMYYRSDGADALGPPVVRSLATLARGQFKVILAPHPELPTGTGLALAAWNKLWKCPSSVTPEQARTIASGFIHTFRGTSNAPEPQAQ